MFDFGKIKEVIKIHKIGYLTSAAGHPPAKDLSTVNESQPPIPALTGLRFLPHGQLLSSILVQIYLS
jgi:hypothetical protein